MIKYIHGSEDSLDVDVIYLFDEMPSFKECQKFCSENKEENRNIAVVKGNRVIDCFKGTKDEINNGIYSTYHLHQQTYPLAINRLVPRDLLIKDIRVVRCILSHCSRTQYREQVKKALKSYDLQDKIDCLSQIDFKNLQGLEEKGTLQDVYKILAFQLGQTLALREGKELFTKSSVAAHYPLLRNFLYREKDVNLDNLYLYINMFIEKLKIYEYTRKDEITYFEKENRYINLKTETFY